MKLSHLILSSLILILVSCSSEYRTENIQEPDESTKKKIEELYHSAQLKKVIPFTIFEMAMIGFYNIEDLKISDKIVIIDYSKPSTAKRFYVIDLENKKLLYQSLVAHGKNSGNNFASTFSNELNSKQSSLGFFITAETYEGKHGYSLKLDGIEKGINHNARERNVVIHQADYVSEKFIQKQGRLGRSWGCPALPKALSEKIINSISGGRCVFIYGNDKSYQQKSKYIPKN